MPWIVDVETDGLLPNVSKIHCIVARNYQTGEVYSFKEHECLSLFPRWLNTVDKLIMHNGVSFDAPVLNKLLGTK